MERSRWSRPHGGRFEPKLVDGERIVDAANHHADRDQLDVQREAGARAEAKRRGVSLAELLHRSLRTLLPANACKSWTRYAGMIELGDPLSSHGTDDISMATKTRWRSASRAALRVASFATGTRAKIGIHPVIHFDIQSPMLRIAMLLSGAGRAASGAHIAARRRLHPPTSLGVHDLTGRSSSSVSGRCSQVLIRPRSCGSMLIGSSSW